jgi:hypothetical protein
MGPSDQDLSCGDRSDVKQAEELWGDLPDQDEDLLFEVFGLGLQGLDALGGGPKGPCCRPVLKVLGGTVPDLGTMGALFRGV